MKNNPIIWNNIVAWIGVVLGIGFLMAGIIFLFMKAQQTASELLLNSKRVYTVEHIETRWMIPDSLTDLAAQRVHAIASDRGFLSQPVDDLVEDVGKLYQRPHYKFALRHCRELKDGTIKDCKTVGIRSPGQKKVFDSLVAFKVSQLTGVQK
jgi:hypothetical protein